MAKEGSSPKGPVSNRDYTNTSVLIIGAGISGICIAIDLIIRSKCHDFVIIEKGNGLGGTWKDNTYPGCCCDVESVLYSYSFEQKADWTRIYPGQEEILDYLITTAQKHDLFKYVRFSTAAEEACWNDETSTWKTKIKVLGGKEAERHSEYTITSSFLVTAVGQLNDPKYPEITGMDKFTGKMMHSARWDWSYDLKDKSVAIIGNGCTAAQIVPEVAKTASQLTVFQRTPAYIIPRYDGPVSPLRQAIYKYITPVRKRVRADVMDFRENVLYNAVKDEGTKASKVLEDMATSHMRTQLSSRPDIWENLTPNYPVGCKRTIISSDFYPALAQQNVHLETSKIIRMTADGIQVEGREHNFDVVVFATGFQTTQFFQENIKITGRDGRSLESIWRTSPRALYGITVESLPNFAMLYGPNTNLGHNSIVLMIEAQSRYINGLIAAILRAHAKGRSLSISPNGYRFEEYNKAIQNILSHSPYASPTCNSWYKNADGTITQNWPGTVVEYQKTISVVDWNDYDLYGDAAELFRERKSNVGRVVEETLVSYRAMGVLAASLVGLAAALAVTAPKVLGLRK